MTVCSVARGHAWRPSPLSGSRKVHIKNAMLSSNGMRLNVSKSMRASMSLYPFAKLLMLSSFEYVWSWMSLDAT